MLRLGRVYAARSVADVVHAGVVELIRPGYATEYGREMVNASFVVSQPAQGLLYAENNKLDARLLFMRVFNEFTHVEFVEALSQIRSIGLSRHTAVVTSHNSLYFCVRYGALHLTVRPVQTALSELAHELCVYSMALVLLARAGNLPIGDLVFSPLSTVVPVEDMEKLYEFSNPLVPWQACALPLPTSASVALTELANGTAKRSFESETARWRNAAFGWLPIIASLNNSLSPLRSDALDTLFANGKLLHAF